LQKLNRVDAAHLGQWKHLIVPSRWDLDELAYSPMPEFIEELTDGPQTLVVDLPAQVFGAYEFGTLVRWGPVSSGRPGDSTPPGRYQLNWKARVRISSVNNSWIMPWYFNFDTITGYGFHKYSLPGRPASHGCVRLLESDAKWVFHWGQSGTPVRILGHYDFSSPRPWMRPAWWSRGVQSHRTGSDDALDQELDSMSPEIAYEVMARPSKRLPRGVCLRRSEAAHPLKAADHRHGLILVFCRAGEQI
jgi:hypothetical protein